MILDEKEEKDRNDGAVPKGWVASVTRLFPGIIVLQVAIGDAAVYINLPGFILYYR